MKIIKIDYITFMNICKFKANNEPYFEYYQIINDRFQGCFIAYDNRFHKNNKYIYPKTNIIGEVNIKDVFKSIRKYFNRPLQIMISSNQTEVISNIINAGFKLKRKTYECKFEQKDIKINIAERVSVKLINTNDELYEEVVQKVYDHYTETHKNISSLTVNLDEFRSVLPKEVYVNVINDKLLNYAFVETNELCYMGSEDINTFDSFAYTIIKKMFKINKKINFEIDDTDDVAMRFKNLFSKKSEISFDTYILKWKLQKDILNLGYDVIDN